MEPAKKTLILLLVAECIFKSIAGKYVHCLFSWVIIFLYLIIFKIIIDNKIWLVWILDTCGVSEVYASTSAVITLPFVAVDNNGLEESYVWSKESGSGKVTFPFSCSQSTEVTFKVEGIAPNSMANSFYVEVDNGSKDTFHFPVTNNWRWETCASKYSVSAGSHELHVLSRERYTKMRRIGFVKGKDTCLFNAPGIFETTDIFLSILSMLRTNSNKY